MIDRAPETARLIASKSPVALRAAKELVNRALAGENEANLGGEAAWFGELFASDDAREGLTAFVERREPRFTGR